MRRYSRFAIAMAALALLTAACGAATPAGNDATPSESDEPPEREVVSTTVKASAPWDHVQIGPRPGDTNAFILALDGGLRIGSIGPDYSTLEIWSTGDGYDYTSAAVTLPTSSQAVTIHDAAVGATGMMMVGNDWEALMANAWMSTDGKDWEAIEGVPGIDMPAVFESVTATAAGFVAGGALRPPDQPDRDPFKPAVWQTTTGDSWQLTELGAALEGWVTSVVTTGESVLAAGSVDGAPSIWESTDSGLTWQPLTTEGLNTQSIYSVSSLAWRSGTIVMAGRRPTPNGFETTTLLASTDGGSTWGPTDLSRIDTRSIGAWGRLRSTDAGFWLITNRIIDAFDDPDLCYTDVTVCQKREFPTVLFSTDGIAW